jgi:hypothetical protein
MLYEIRDPLLGARAVLRLHAIALHQTDGLVVRIAAEGLSAPVELIAAYGGLSGRRGVRDGDIGTEAVPIGQYFQLKPESCLDNRFTLGAASSGAFTLRPKLRPSPAWCRPERRWPSGTPGNGRHSMPCSPPPSQPPAVRIWRLSPRGSASLRPPKSGRFSPLCSVYQISPRPPWPKNSQPTATSPPTVLASSVRLP